MKLGLDGKVALVCGASRGLGKAVAETLAAEGAAVALCARHADVVATASEISSQTRTDTLGLAIDLSVPGGPTKAVTD